MHFYNLAPSMIIFGISILVVAKDDVEPFKINKLNLVWTKAQHSLGSGKLKDLKSDLLKHEADELNLKKLKAHNQDKDGLIEAAVRKKLLTIMKKYAMERYYDDVHPLKPVDRRTAEKDSHSADDSAKVPIFRDSKLDKLWKKAEKFGFSQEQLMLLHEEFQHQQDKLDEHHETLNTIEDEINKLKSSKNDNSLDSDIENSGKKRAQKSRQHETPSEKKARLELDTHQGLRDKQSNIKKGFEDLQEKISTGVIDSDKPFEEDQVNNLWSAALRLNFSREDLESLKEELEHYEKRIKKLKHFQNQLERHRIAGKESSANMEEEDDDDEMKHIRRRVKDLSEKVEKAHKTVEKMINRQRDEL